MKPATKQNILFALTPVYFLFVMFVGVPLIAYLIKLMFWGMDYVLNELPPHFGSGSVTLLIQ